ncbi:MAG: type II CAAX prenyl endopeptidase Rce1 family protein [Campylobacterales bacterium]
MFSKSLKFPLLFLEGMLFVVVPLLLFFKIVDVFEIWLLLISLIYPVLFLYFKKFDFRGLLQLPSTKQLRWVVYRFAFFGSALALMVVLFFGDMLFSFVLNMPYIFATVILLYPLLSVVPQEIIYRVFFFERYERFFAKSYAFVIINIFVFAYMHIVFDNIYAPLLSIIGGAIFTLNYYRHRNFILLVFEHTLYGWLIFTLGIGRFFYIGG